MRILIITVLCLCFSCPAVAQPTPIELQVGSQGEFFAVPGGLTLANDATWFTFTLTSQTEIDIDISRTVPHPDLGASLFAGDVTGFSFQGLLVSQMFMSSFGPLSFREFADDEEDDMLGGPNGDPHFQNIILNPGTYSVMVFSFTNPGGNFIVESNVGTIVDIAGDANCDGVVNLLDIEPFVNLISSGEFSSKADLTGDGAVNLLDVVPFIDLLSAG